MGIWESAIGTLGGTFFIVDTVPHVVKSFGKPTLLYIIVHCVPLRHYDNQNICTFPGVQRGPILTMLGIKALGGASPYTILA